MSHRFINTSKQGAQMYFDCCLGHFRTSVSTSSSSAKRLPSSCELLYATDTSNSKQGPFLYEYSLHWVLLPITKRALERCFSVFTPQTRSPFSLLKPASEYGRYLDDHEAGLCRCLVIYIQNLLHLLQLFYLHLWPFNWLTLVLDLRCLLWSIYIHSTVTTASTFMTDNN
jgi:hypothetical protein